MVGFLLCLLLARIAPVAGWRLTPVTVRTENNEWCHYRHSFVWTKLGLCAVTFVVTAITTMTFKLCFVQTLHLG